MYVFLFTFFSLPFIFTLVACSISHFLTTVTKFSCYSTNKKCIVFFLLLQFSVALSLLIKLCWPVTYFLFFSVFFFLYIPNLWTQQLIKASNFRQHGYRNNFYFLFFSLLTLQLSLLHNTRVATRFPAKISSSCIWVAISVDCCLILHWYAYGTEGQSLGWAMYGHLITKFSRMDRFSQLWGSTCVELCY